jgi:DNA modification methylase
MESNKKGPKKANELSGSEWTKFSISVWNDITKSAEEKKLKHPALYPSALVSRLIGCFTNNDDINILDPFMGTGSTLVAAQLLGKRGIGFEISEEYISKASSRLSQVSFYKKHDPLIHKASSFNMLDFLEPETIDLCVTSPPYWDILLQKRTADNKEIRHYGNSDEDLGRIEDYWEFLNSLMKVFKNVLTLLKPEKYCIVNVMDLRKKEKFYPYHSDLAKKMEEIGFIFDDIIIWDRRQEYNNLRTLGYPSVFRLNKIHEYLLIFKKPKRV